MFKLLAIGLVLVTAGVVFYYFAQHEPPLQGLSTLESGVSVLASRAKPPVVLVPSPDMALLHSGFKRVRPQDREQSAPSVLVSFAVYNDNSCHLVLALAETSGEWVWEALQHCPYASLRTIEEPYAKAQVYKSIFLLQPKADPFKTSQMTQLVLRAKFLLSQRKRQVLIEYREPVTQEQVRLLNIDLNNSYISQFYARALRAWSVQFPSIDAVKTLTINKLAASDIERTGLAPWLGEVEHPGHGR
ncbi:MAG: DUF4851 domain-containing protein [Desulfovibrionaceae bacterium]|nr:DUF4851 domain-containing protein [Desulfovibrionaceae bacterium]